MSERPVIHVDRRLSEMDAYHVADRAEIVGPGDGELAGAAAAVIGVAHHWDAPRFAQYPDLRVVARMGIGYDNVDLGDARAAGVVVCNAPDAPTVSTAEHTLALMLTVTKHIRGSSSRADAGLGGVARPTSLELDGATLGLVGLGRVAARVAVATQALGMTVIAHDPFVESSPVPGVELVGLHDIWARADVISLHAPATEATHHLVCARTLDAMRDGVYLVNCARGSLVDQEALVVALDSDKVLGAGLDVTDPEPLPEDHPLLGRSDVIVTPHVASSTRVGRHRLFAHAFDAALGSLAGHPANVVT